MPNPTAPLPGRLAPDPPSVEHRAAPRYRSARRPALRVVARPTFRCVRAVVRDVSVRGLALLVAERFEPGTVLAVELRERDGEVSGVLTARVRHLRRAPGDLWLVGCSLSRTLTDDELAALL